MWKSLCTIYKVSFVSSNYSLVVNYLFIIYSFTHYIDGRFQTKFPFKDNKVLFYLKFIHSFNYRKTNLALYLLIPPGIQAREDGGPERPTESHCYPPRANRWEVTAGTEPPAASPATPRDKCRPRHPAGTSPCATRSPSQVRRES